MIIELVALEGHRMMATEGGASRKTFIQAALYPLAATNDYSAKSWPTDWNKIRFNF